MPVDPTPWFREDASHSANVARILADAAFRNREGIVASTDCEVRELDVPGTSVRVFPGTCSMRNKANGSQARGEMFAGRVPSETEVPIAATGSGAGRSDMIVARVYTLGETPAVPNQFFDLYVISGVPSSATKISETDEPYITGIPLARIDLPVSTGTITQAMITDLRKMSGVRNQRDFHVVAPTNTQSLDSSGFVNWPSQANLAVDVPDWATSAKVRAILAGIRHGDAGASSIGGQLRIQFGDEPNASYGQGVSYNLALDGGFDTATLMAAAAPIAVPSVYRGGQATVRVEGFKNFGGTASLEVNPKSMLTLEVEFIEEPETNV